MASFEKMAKILLEETGKTAHAAEQIAEDIALLRIIAKNQDIMIRQNERIIELLSQRDTAKANE